MNINWTCKTIVVGHLLHKMKWIQTLVAGAAIPISLLLYKSGIITLEWCSIVLCSNIMITVNLYSFAQLFHQAVGFMYLSEDESVLKISYLDFWGRRIDTEVPVNDIVPFSDAPWKLTQFLFKDILLYSDKKLKPKLYLKAGEIMDKEKFIKVFGLIE